MTRQVLVWKFISLFLFGILSGVVVLRFFSSDNSVDETAKGTDDRISIPFQETASKAERPDNATRAAVFHAQDLMRTGDRYLLGGNPVLALDYYDRYDIHSQLNDSTLLLRKAICYESAGQGLIAEQAYQRSLANSKSANHTLLAAAGLARTLARQQRIAESIDAAREHLLTVDRAETVPVETRALLIYQWAKGLEARTWNETSEDTNFANLLPPMAQAVDRERPRPELLLRLIDLPADDPDTAKAALSLPDAEDISIELLQAPSPQADTISLSLRSSLQPVANLLKSLSETVELEIRLSDTAQKSLAGRSSRIQFSAVTLSSLLDQLLIPFDLIWQQDERVIVIGSPTEFGPQLATEFRFQSANRALRRFEIDFPESEFRQASLLSRGALALRQAKFDRAANLFQELEQSRPNDEIRARLFFNLGKLALLLDRPSEAKTFFYRSVDQTLNKNLQATSYCLLSGLHLSSLELDEAIKTGRRGLAIATSDRQKQHASLHLTRAYLLNRNPFAANDTLFRNRQVLENAGNATSVAAVLGAYARMIGSSDKQAVFKAKRRAMEAAVTLKPDQVLSFADAYIASMTFQKVGIQNRAIESLVVALSQPDLGAWQRPLMFELGRLQFESEKHREAAATFSALQQLDDQWKTKAMFELAALYFQHRQFEECIEVCRALLQQPLDDSTKQATLLKLGRAHRAQGQHFAAGLCFAGVLPDDIPDEPQAINATQEQ